MQILPVDNINYGITIVKVTPRSLPTDMYMISLCLLFVNSTVMPHKKFVTASSILCSLLSKVTIGQPFFSIIKDGPSIFFLCYLS